MYFRYLECKSGGKFIDPFEKHNKIWYLKLLEKNI